MTIDFNTPVRRSGVPQYALSTGELPASCVQTSPTQVDLTYVTGGVITDITIPQNDPAIRSQTGGYVTPGTFPAS